MWTAAAVASVRSASVLLTVSAAIVALNFFTELSGRSSGAGTTSTFVWCYLAFAAHSVVLKNTAGFATSGTGWQMFRFIWRTIVLSVIPALVIIPILLSGVNAESDTPKEVMILAALLVAMPLFLIEFALFGTMLPAVVMDRGYGIGRTLKRGLKTFFGTAGRLIIGPGLMMLIAVGFYTFFPHTGDAMLISEQGEIQTFNLIPEIITTLIFAYSTVLTAVVLSKAYITGEEKLGPSDNSASAEPPKQEPTVADSGS